ncbi:polyadenylate-binding protein-interacting protein 2B-like [Watersipora subatra]|uniref:polyadenylate-binding protein-interacting protein 2B-like n=1 Tax=Watersipora subatra TaxID=2589382 RepID=UPI00355B2672
MKKPEEYYSSGPDFSEYMWMAEDGAEEGLQQQIEEEMELIEQDFLEAMFEDLLREEDEKESYYGPTEGAEDKSKCEMQLPRIQSQLNPDAPEFVPRFTTTSSA